MISEVKRLSYSVPGKTILKEVSFSIQQGDFIGLLGPNGSGKTTLLKVLSGVHRNYDGSVLLDSREVKGLSAKELAKTISVVPQDAHFAIPFTALEVVLMGRNAYQKYFAFDSKRDLELARDAMRRCDCLQFADRKVDTLSGGEKQRVLLARALCQAPRLLLLDEPANHLDLKHQQELYRLLKTLNREEKLTILCVVHDVNAAANHCERIFLIKEGRLELQGPKGEVLSEQNLSAVFDIPFGRADLTRGGSYFFPR